MRHLLASKTISILIIAILVVVPAGGARAQPLSRSVEIHRPMDQAYASISNYLSPDSIHDFKIISVSRSAAKAEFVATRTLRDKTKWSEWAYCEVPTMQMLDTLNRGNVKVKVVLERESKDHTYVTATVDFQGIYNTLGSNGTGASATRTQQCASNGVLEKDLLRAAGAAHTDVH